MKKTLPALPLVFAACFAAVAQAEPTDLGGGFAQRQCRHRQRLPLPWLFADRLRPAAQLGIDLTHSSGFYLGNWNSNVSSFVYTDGNLEMDFYGGWKGDVGGGLTLDARGAALLLPGSSSPKGGNYNNTDLYLAATYANYTLKYSYTPGDFFSTPDSKGTWYLDGTANFDLGDGWGLVGHLGYQKLKNQTNMNGDSISHYVDYKLGVTKDLKVVLGLAAVGATKDNWLPTKYGHPSGRLGAVFSVARSF